MIRPLIFEQLNYRPAVSQEFMGISHNGHPT
jgi:hypothetical protein